MTRHSFDSPLPAQPVQRARLEFELETRYHFAVLRGLSAPSPWVKPMPGDPRHTEDAVRLPPF